MAEGGETEGPFEVVSLNDITISHDTSIIKEVEHKQTERQSVLDITIDALENVYKPAKHTLSIFSGILALVSTCVGGGIVGFPRAFYYLGIPLAIVLNFVAIFAMYYSVRLYLAAKDICPNKPESLYEIGYHVMGRKVIYILGCVYAVASLGFCMVFFITYGDTMGQLVATFSGEGIELDSVWYTSRCFHVFVLAVILTPVILKK